MNLLLALTLVAAQMLDFDMSPQEQKMTGIARLNDRQKKALQEWIDAHYVKREQPLQPKSGAHPILQDNLNNGTAIRLSDNSVWEINPQDVPITQGWITPTEIIITQSGNRDYPVQLTNSLTGSSVSARKTTLAPTRPPAGTSTSQ